MKTTHALSGFLFGVDGNNNTPAKDGWKMSGAGKTEIKREVFKTSLE